MEIQLKSLIKNFGGKKVLNIPKFSLASGSQSVLMGSSGQGKTTLLNILSGLLLPTSGEVKLNEVLINQLSNGRRDKFRGKNIGYIFQSFNLLPELNLFDNVSLTGKFSEKGIDKDKIVHSLESVGLEDKVYGYPSTLSSGQKQRVAVVRAMIHHPGLILADEPTGSLDMENKINVIEIIKSQCKKNGCTLLLISHDPWVAEQFDDVYKFKKINEIK